MAEQLTLTTLNGTARRCGEAYGRQFAQPIMGFCQQEVKPDRSRLSFADRCWKHIEKDAPTSADFIRGMAAGSDLSRAHITLLTLHEEIVHLPHCTAFVATGPGTRGGKTINAQNWDWAPSLYDWPGLLKLSIKGVGQTLTYQYPGLWACAGVNQAGLSLMWTGSGYFPSLRPRVGLPTYVLIAEILRQKSVAEAIGYINSVKHAGAFIFFLGDAHGSAAVVEGMPGRTSVETTDRVLTRANHYVCPEMVRCSEQKLPRSRKYTTIQRAARIAEIVDPRPRNPRPRKARPRNPQAWRMTLGSARKILTDRSGDWPWLHQYPGGGQHALTLDGMTIDSLIAVSQDRVLHTCRGGRVPGSWQSVGL